MTFIHLTVIIITYIVIILNNIFKFDTMSRRCELPICTKKSMVATNRKLLRGNYNPTSKHTQKVNVQPYTLPDGTRVKACTTCIRTINKSLSA